MTINYPRITNWSSDDRSEWNKLFKNEAKLEQARKREEAEQKRKESAERTKRIFTIVVCVILVLALGIPMAIQSAAVNFSKIILTSWINLFDVTYSALAGVFNKINLMSGVISQSFTAAGSTMVGQNLGAREYRRVNQILLTIGAFCLGIAILMTSAMLLWPDAIYGIFTADADVLMLASVLTLPIILNFFGSATRSVAFSLINGSGNSRLNLMIAIFDGIVCRIGLSYVLGFTLGLSVKGFWLGDGLAGYIPMVVALIFYVSGRWKTDRLVNS